MRAGRRRRNKADEAKIMLRRQGTPEEIQSRVQAEYQKHLLKELEKNSRAKRVGRTEQKHTLPLFQAFCRRKLESKIRLLKQRRAHSSASMQMAGWNMYSGYGSSGALGVPQLAQSAAVAAYQQQLQQQQLRHQQIQRLQQQQFQQQQLQQQLQQYQQMLQKQQEAHAQAVAAAAAATAARAAKAQQGPPSVRSPLPSTSSSSSLSSIPTAMYPSTTSATSADASGFLMQQAPIGGNGTVAAGTVPAPTPSSPWMSMGSSAALAFLHTPPTPQRKLVVPSASAATATKSSLESKLQVPAVGQSPASDVSAGAKLRHASTSPFLPTRNPAPAKTNTASATPPLQSVTGRKPPSDGSLGQQQKQQLKHLEKLVKSESSQRKQILSKFSGFLDGKGSHAPKDGIAGKRKGPKLSLSSSISASASSSASAPSTSASDLPNKRAKTQNGSTTNVASSNSVTIPTPTRTVSPLQSNALMAPGSGSLGAYTMGSMAPSTYMNGLLFSPLAGYGGLASPMQYGAQFSPGLSSALQTFSPAPHLMGTALSPSATLTGLQQDDT